MKARIGIIGDGNVGTALRRGCERAGYDVRAVGADAKAVRETGEWAEMVILAVPYSAVDDTLEELGPSARGKILIDVTNPLTKDMKPALNFSRSGTEILAEKMPDAKVIKAFNSVFADHMDSGHVKDWQLTGFVAGDDVEAKRAVLKLVGDLGFDAVDAGPIENARLLEALAYLNIQLGMRLGLGREIGFKLHR